MNTRKQGFTLVELLVVIAIIGVLAALILIGIQKARKKASIAATKVFLKNVATALETYSKNDYGSAYPTADDTGKDEGQCQGIQTVAKMVCSGPNDGGGIDGPYLKDVKGWREFSNNSPLPKGSQVNKYGELLDRWRKPLHYRSRYAADGVTENTNVKGADYDIYSWGPDKKEGGKDDIFYP
ncbi:MAG: prepilin-type N-terminal cleavage/methylation domain-containing protein [Planctomycetota bacterium]|nr:MAG: prepilin-type N-terminal cleavage/methylation domain-containing protein [Planctomycetota bacterium]